MTQALPSSLQPGDPAPEFTLPSIQDGTVSLTNYRHRSPVFLALFSGLYCPFCRRAIAQMAASADKLKEIGVESLGIVATELENARLYFRFRPVRLPLAVDPAMATHRSFGVPRLDFTPDFMEAMATVQINPHGELPRPMSIPEAAQALNAIDGFQPTPVDQREGGQPFAQLKGVFLIDRGGVIRWVNVECQREGGPSGVGKFPTVDELVSAAQIAAAV